jgi:hypothetical protein
MSEDVNRRRAEREKPHDQELEALQAKHQMTLLDVTARVEVGGSVVAIRFDTGNASSRSPMRVGKRELTAEEMNKDAAMYDRLMDLQRREDDRLFLRLAEHAFNIIGQYLRK